MNFRVLVYLTLLLTLHNWALSQSTSELQLPIGEHLPRYFPLLELVPSHIYHGVTTLIHLDTTHYLRI